MGFHFYQTIDGRGEEPPMTRMSMLEVLHGNQLDLRLKYSGSHLIVNP